MSYKLIISPRAQQEIENAIEYYSLIEPNLGTKFINALETTYKSIRANPFHGKRYKNIRSLKIYKFPYSLFFTVDEEQNLVKILSCFHNSLNPEKKPL
jgi:plasmid stabilization system protein ParE